LWLHKVKKGGNMLSRCSHVMLASLLILGVVLAGCAKRPATTQAAAPAPTGAAATTPGGGAAQMQPSSGGTGGPSGGGTAGGGTTAAPSTTRPAVSEFVAVADLKDIHFDFDKYDIRPVDAKMLDGDASWLKSNPNHLVLIEGHCDERGTNEYNLALGERRTNAVKEYLVGLGIATDRLVVVSKGEETPVCTEETAACFERNRRGHFVITAK
jgi:peptidoglycan-associated lipoprotein